MSRMTVMLAVLAGVLALLVPVALADQTYDDPAADSGAAPDITSVAVTNDNTDRVTFRIRLAQPGQLTTDTVVWLLIDLDRNSNTGGDDGEERVIAYDGESDGYYYESWNGTALEPGTPATSRFSYGTPRSRYRFRGPTSARRAPSTSGSMPTSTRARK